MQLFSSTEFPVHSLPPHSLEQLLLLLFLPFPHWAEGFRGMHDPQLDQELQLPCITRSIEVSSLTFRIASNQITTTLVVAAGLTTSTARTCFSSARR